MIPKIALATIAIALTSTQALAQRCATLSQAAFGFGRQANTLHGIVCRSREAAIGAAYHYRYPKSARVWLDIDDPSRDDVVRYVNEYRNEGADACYLVPNNSPILVEKMSEKVHADGDGKNHRVRVVFWQIKVEGMTGTVVTAHYDGCYR